MKDSEKIVKLKQLFCEQIAWYQEHEDDQDLIYDDLIGRFDELRRGDYVELIEILLEKSE